MNDSRTEDGTIVDCRICGVTAYLHREDMEICPLCAWEGWRWTKASRIRRGDTIALVGRENNHQAADVAQVDADEDWDLRKVIHLVDGRTWIRRQTDLVLERVQ